MRGMLAGRLSCVLVLHGFGAQAAKGRIWINLTTGTWPSPFFLLWVPLLESIVGVCSLAASNAPASSHHIPTTPFAESYFRWTAFGGVTETFLHSLQKNGPD